MSSDGEAPDSQQDEREWNESITASSRALLEDLRSQHLTVQEQPSFPPTAQPISQPNTTAATQQSVLDTPQDPRTSILCSYIFKMLRDAPAGYQESLARELELVSEDRLASAVPAVIDVHYRRAAPWRVKKIRVSQKDTVEDDKGDVSTEDTL
jgi:hypothetical protein